MSAGSPGTAAAEDSARAQCYALISRLFYAPPDAELLAALGGAAAETRSAGGDGESDGYSAALLELGHAASSAELAAVRQEFDDLFVGAGKALITPYTSAYAAPSAPDRHLVALREQLAAWRLGRRESVFETEDHVAAVCDVMRWLIEREHSLHEQRAFFDAFLYCGAMAFCSAIEVSGGAVFYRPVARLASAFFRIESDAFALEAED